MPVGRRDGSPGVILVQNVEKSYGGRTGRTVHALRGVSLAITEPGFYAIMGPSGSGKSTLLHLLAGLDRPDRGRIEVDGSEVSSMPETMLTSYRRLRIGIVFQHFNLIPTLDAVNNAMLPGILDGRPAEWCRQRALSLLAQFGLAQRALHRPEALSGGEQQRVAIARALLFEPKVILADEPSGNLDSMASEQLWAVLEELADQRGITILMVTHEPSAAVHCRRVYVLKDGRVHGELDAKGEDAGELANRYQHLVG